MIRYLLIFNAVLIVILATLQGLFLASLPMVDYFRGDVETVLSKRLGASVSIAHLGAKTSWTGPYLEAVDVQIQHKEAGFKIKRVLVLFDLIGSAEALEPVIETLILDSGEIISHHNLQDGIPSPQLWPDILDKTQTILASLGKFHMHRVDVVLGNMTLKQLSLESMPETGIVAKTRLVTEKSSYPVELDWRFANESDEHDLRFKTTISNTSLSIPEIENSVSLVGTFWSTVSPKWPASVKFAVSEDNSTKLAKVHATGELVWNRGRSNIWFDQLQIKGPGVRIAGNGARAVYGQSHAYLELIKISFDGRAFGEYVDISETMPKLNRLLRANGPLINLSNVRVHWDRHKDPYLDAVIDSLSVSAANGIPAIGPLQGQLVLTGSGGFIDFSGKNAQFELPEIFINPWVNQNLKGILAFHHSQTGLVIKGHDLVVTDADQYVTGHLLLDLSKNATQLIQVEVLANVNQNAIQGLTPINLDANILDFLKKSFFDLVVEGGRVSYSGPVGNDLTQLNRKLSLHLPMKNFRFQPLKKWPAFEGNDGLVELHEDQMKLALINANFGGLEIPKIKIWQSKKNTQIFQISGQIKGPAATTFKILEQAKVKPVAIDRDIFIKGLLTGDIHLNIPIDGLPEGYIDLAAESLTLDVVGFEESIEQIAGSGRYTLNKGFESNRLSGILAGDQISGKVSVQDAAFQIQARGTLAIQNVIRHINIPFPESAVTGSSEWIGSINRKNQDLSILLETDGIGIESQLPMPLNKFPEKAGRIMVSRERNSYKDEFTSEIFENTKISGQLGNSPLVIEVITPEADLARWATFFDVEGDVPSIAMLLRLDAMMLGNTPISMNEVALNLRPNYINLALDGDDLAGRVERIGQGPLVIELEKIVLPEGDDWLDPPQSDLLIDVNPGEFPSARIDINELHRGDVIYRNLHAKLVSGDNRLDASDLSFVRDEQLFEGELSWVSRNSEILTAINLRAEGPELGRFLRVNEDEPLLEAQSGKFFASLTWEGSPLGFSALTSDGVLQLNLKKGRFLDLGNSAEVLRLFGILNIETVTRRLRLDFLDLVQPGVAFDSVDTQATLSNGILTFDPEFSMSGPSSSFKMTGDANLRAKTLNQLLEVDIPLTNNLPLASVLLGAPQVGGAIYLVEKALGKKLIKVGKTDYRIEGSFSDPQVSLIPPFSKKKEVDNGDASTTN